MSREQADQLYAGWQRAMERALDWETPGWTRFDHPAAADM